MASSILLFAVIINILKFNLFFDYYYTNLFINLLIISTLFLKRGTAPFHFWFPTVIEGLTWINALILITWQKIAPLILISYFNLKLIFIRVILLSIIIGSLGGLNQTSLKKIIAFSSINHLGWIIRAIISRESLFLIYFIIYCFLSINLVYFFNIIKLYHINQLFSIFFNSKIIKFRLFINLLSLGGLPPFLGFLPKWIVIQTLTINSQLLLITLITIITLVTLYFYLRICYSAFILNYHENNWLFNIHFNNFEIKLYLLFSFISTFSLFCINIIYFIF